MNDVGAIVGVPEAQRGHHAVDIVPTLIDDDTRPIAKTLRKLTRAERLLRSGAIDKRQSAAIDLYVAAAELAYGSCVRASSYGEGGGSSPTGAASAAHARQLDRAYDADRYQRARAAIGRHAVPFERIVLDNHPIMAVGADLYPAASTGSISGAMRQMVRQCADAIHLAFERELSEHEVPNILKTMKRFDEAVRASHQPTAARPISDAIAQRVLAAPSGCALFIAPSVLADLLRENALKEPPATWCGMPLEIRQHWQFGWLVQAA